MLKFVRKKWGGFQVIGDYRAQSLGSTAFEERPGAGLEDRCTRGPLSPRWNSSALVVVGFE